MSEASVPAPLIVGWSDSFSSHDNNSKSNTSSKNALYSPLPKNFTPGPYSVICGRGRQVSKAIGNRRLGVLAQIFLPKYSTATRKDEKTSIVSQIVQIVRQANDNPAYAFVRHADGQWWQVENLNAREKVGTVLRDMLSEKYRSSTKSKLARRKERTYTPTLIVEDSPPLTSSLGPPPPYFPNPTFLHSTPSTPSSLITTTLPWPIMPSHQPQHATSMMTATSSSLRRASTSSGLLPCPAAGNGIGLYHVSSDDDDDDGDDLENYSTKDAVSGTELEMDSLFGP